MGGRREAELAQLQGEDQDVRQIKKQVRNGTLSAYVCSQFFATFKMMA